MGELGCVTCPPFVVRRSPFSFSRIANLDSATFRNRVASAGVIIRVETVVHKKGALHNYYDAERMRITQWTESASEDKLFTYFLRVFTLKSAANQRRGRIGECIGVTKFGQMSINSLWTLDPG